MVPAPQHFSTALTLDLPPGCLHGTGIKPPSQKGVSQSGVGNSQYFFASVYYQILSILPGLAIPRGVDALAVRLAAKERRVAILS